MIGPDGIQAMLYSDLAKEQLRCPCLDLVGGLIHRSGRAPEVLGESQTRLLIGVIGAGAVGVKDWALVDFIYRQEFSDFDSSFERLKTLLKQSAKRGVRVVREKNTYRFVPDDWSVVMPSDLRSRGAHAWASVMLPLFRREELEKIFGIPARTANRWIQDWQAKGLVTRVKAGRQSKYSFLR
jgi:sugar/nucleoside kinase (ribokinase family)